MPLDTGEIIGGSAALLSLMAKVAMTARSLPPDATPIKVWAHVIRTHIDEAEQVATQIQEDVKD